MSTIREMKTLIKMQMPVWRKFKDLLDPNDLKRVIRLYSSDSEEDKQEHCHHDGESTFKKNKTKRCSKIKQT